MALGNNFLFTASPSRCANYERERKKRTANAYNPSRSSVKLLLRMAATKAMMNEQKRASATHLGRRTEQATSEAALDSAFETSEKSVIASGAVVKCAWRRSRSCARVLCVLVIVAALSEERFVRERALSSATSATSATRATVGHLSNERDGADDRRARARRVANADHTRGLCAFAAASRRRRNETRQGARACKQVGRRSQSMSVKVAGLACI